MEVMMAVVVPIVTFGSELWVLSDKDIENLLNFERFAGRRIQRFPPRTPNSTSFYGLGWSKLTTYIGMKKLLFAMTIIRMKAENVIRTIFERRLDDFLNNIREAECNARKSPFFEIFTTSNKFGLLERIRAVPFKSVGGGGGGGGGEERKLIKNSAPPLPALVQNSGGRGGKAIQNSPPPPEPKKSSLPPPLIQCQDRLLASRNVVMEPRDATGKQRK